MVVVVMVVHVLHRDPAPDANHKGFNLALVAPASNAEVAVLSPVLSPGVGSDLKRKIQSDLIQMMQILSRQQEKKTGQTLPLKSPFHALRKYVSTN